MDENFWKAMAASVARKAMMAVATYLTTKGLLASGDQGQFVNIAVGIVVGAGALAWDWWKNVGHAKLQARVAAMQSVSKQQAQAPSGPNVARVLVPLAILVLGLSLLASPALAQAKKKPALTGNAVQDIQNALSGGATAGASSNEGALGTVINTALAKPLQDLAAFIGEDNAGAIDLSTKIANLQDLNGKACWMAFSDTASVFKAHPVPLTFKLMQDLEAHRLLVWSAYNLCHNPACAMVFSDLQNEATALAGGISPPNVFSQICSKISNLAQQLPAAALPPAVTAPAATPTNSTTTNAPGTVPSAPAAAPTTAPTTPQ